MRSSPSRRLLVACLPALLGWAACGEDAVHDPATDLTEGPSDSTTTPVPDFSLVDVNPTSATYGRAVSPRDHLGKVTAWYFGSAT